MWSDIHKLLPEFDSAVLTAIDVDGYPFSVRCEPTPDEAANCFRIPAQPHELQMGAASLLYHKQGPYINELKSFLLRGELQRDETGWVFTPKAFVPGIGIGGAWAQIQYLLAGKRNAKRYLEKRGIPYPKVDWDAIESAASSSKE